MFFGRSILGGCYGSLFRRLSLVPNGKMDVYRLHNVEWRERTREFPSIDIYTFGEARGGRLRDVGSLRRTRDARVK